MIGTHPYRELSERLRGFSLPHPVHDFERKRSALCSAFLYQCYHYLGSRIKISDIIAKTNVDN